MRITIKLVLFVAIIILPFDHGYAALDKWGGDDRVKSPTSKYTTGTVASAGSYTLTHPDAFTGKTLGNCILQPNINEEVYYLIKSNTDDSITVYGSDTQGDAAECHRHVSDDASKGDTYAVLNQWSAEKVNGRWWLFDPYGNSFFIKAVNGYGGGGAGVTWDNTTLTSNLRAKHGVGSNAAAYGVEIDFVKSMGFNSFGSIVNLYDVVPGRVQAVAEIDNNSQTRYVPYIAQIRLGGTTSKKFTPPNTDAFTVSGDNMWDANDPDFQSDIETQVLIQTGAITDGIRAFNNRTYWAAHYITPYEKAKYGIAANPYYIGLDWDEEPRYLTSEMATRYTHLGYEIITSSAGTHRKTAAVAKLQTLYASIGDLNTAWGTNYENWPEIESDTGSTYINAALSAEPKIMDFGPNNESNAAMKADLDEIAAGFWRVYCKKVHDALDNLIAVHKLNFGPGYHGWFGDETRNFDGLMTPLYYFKGTVDGGKFYHDVLGIGDPMHGWHEDYDDLYEYMRNDLQIIYAIVGRPFMHESCWITAEADSGVTHSGTITGLTSTVLTDSSKDFNLNMNWSYTYGSASWFYILLNADNVPSSNRHYFKIMNGGTGSTTLTVEWEHGPGNNWQWDSSPTMTRQGAVGQTYHIVCQDSFGMASSHGPPATNLFIPLTQEDRAAYYVAFLDQMVNLKASNDDYMMVGYSNWRFFDDGFMNSTGETRNFGFKTMKVNAYDGIEATMANGELQDCGNFVGPVKSKLNNIYDDILNFSPNHAPNPPQGVVIEDYQ